MQIKFYKKPDGRVEIIELKNIYPDDETYFLENGVILSIEELNFEIVIYAEVGLDEEDEPIELLEIVKLDCRFKDALKSLRQQCEEWFNAKS